MASFDTFRYYALQKSDPYDACFYGATEHPRYHDCDNCEHIADKTCEYGMGQKTSEDLKAAIAEGKAMLASYPKLDPKRLP